MSGRRGDQFIIAADEIATGIIREAEESSNEEDLRIRVEYLLRRRIFEKLQIPWAKYESKTGKGVGTVVNGEADALYGKVIIEYESPGKFGERSNVKNAGYKHAVRQITEDYIPGMAKDPKEYGRYLGIVIDGFHIGFVRYRNGWIDDGPHTVDKITTMKMLEAIRGSQRKPLNAETLKHDLGPRSIISKSLVQMLYYKLTKSTSIRTNMLFDDWRRVFHQVCGYNPENMSGLEQTFEIKGKNVNYEALLFSIHTYYALIMKLIAAEVASLTAESFLQSYVEKIRTASLQNSTSLRKEFTDLEEGGIFHSIGIKNFLEGDYFSWYLDHWDSEMIKSLRELVEVLCQYEAGTVELEPDNIQDMLKNVYQFLVPKEIRRKLGEYYTPDWLADLVLNEVGYDGDVRKRFLDPSCGSGTFLVSAIKRVKKFHYGKTQNNSEILELILKNIMGFDLNPLAVIASRTNYLLSIGSLRRYRRTDIEIPVFLADSILVETKKDVFGKDLYVLRTTVHMFEIPVDLIESNLLNEFITMLDESVSNGTTPGEFQRKIQQSLSLDETNSNACVELYKIFLKLEANNKNRIWGKIIKNSFAPIFSGRFDFVVGNPPWIRWENLPESYRKLTADAWKEYGLLKQTSGVGLGKSKKDMAMLFVAVSVKNYLSEKGKLSFLLPFTIFKNQAGGGFRTFLHTKTEMIILHDMVELMPFEDTINRTALIVLKHGKSKFPLKSVTWHKKKAGPMFDLPLVEIMRITERQKTVTQPITSDMKPDEPWMMSKHQSVDAMKKALARERSEINPSTIVEESSSYNADAGVFTGLNGVYWIDILAEGYKKLTIRNRIDAGRNENLPSVTSEVERSLIYPLLRGRDIEKWKVNHSSHIIMPVENGKIIPATEMRITYPNAYDYFKNFFNYLINRKAEPFKTQLEPYSRLKLEVAESQAPPFYWLFNLRKCFSPYKVVWKEISGKISGKGDLVAAVSRPIIDSNGKKRSVIPDHKIIFLPIEREDEAFYVCGILNSSLIHLIVASYTIETAMDTHIVKNIRIPPFDVQNSNHIRISSLAKQAHSASNDKLSGIEKQLDKEVSRLYRLTNEERLSIY